MLDPLDRRILAALHVDARASYRNLGRTTGTTTPTLIARIRRMEELGILRGYRPVLAPPPGQVYECISEGQEPPGTVLEQTAYADGHVRWTMLAEDDTSVRRWAQANGIAIGWVETRTVASGPGTPTIQCHQCGGPLPERPLEARVAGRRHVFCCVTCRDRLVARAQRHAGDESVVESGLRHHPHGRAP